MINQAGLDLIKRWEGFRAEAYQDSVGVWTIGYGTTARAGVGIKPRPGMRITEAQAEKYLRLAVDKFARQIRPLITYPINENQFAAFVSLAYNIGPGAFAKSTALQRFNAGDLDGAADAMMWFNKAGGRVLRGLINRREDEVRLFKLHPRPSIDTPPAVAQSTQNPAVVLVFLAVAGVAIFWRKIRAWIDRSRGNDRI